MLAHKKELMNEASIGDTLKVI